MDKRIHNCGDCYYFNNRTDNCILKRRLQTKWFFAPCEKFLQISKKFTWSTTSKINLKSKSNALTTISNKSQEF